MAKLNLKEIDFKRLMLEKGERFALWAMVGVMALLIVFGVFINGFSRGSASANSAEINDICTRTNSSLQTSAPDDKARMIDPEFNRAATLNEINGDQVLCAHAWFTNQNEADKKWRKPDVL